MNFIIYDLEFNQAFSKDPENKIFLNKQCPFEIIQIGALKLNEELKVIDSFNTLIKPILYPILHPYVEGLTNLTNEDLRNAPTFKDIYKKFLTFLKGDNNILCVWGTADIKELIRNFEYNSLSISKFPKKYINIQKCACKYFKYTKGQNIGLKTAVKLLDIDTSKDFHNAFNDAYYTSEVFKKIYNKDIKPKFYTFSKTRQNKNHKQNLDTNLLFNQFEKMLQRKITQEEKEIIKLAYIMGKTNQFLTK